MIRGPICSLNASMSISTGLPEDDGALCVQEVTRVATRIGHAQFHDGLSDVETDLIYYMVPLNACEKRQEWQLALGTLINKIERRSVLAKMDEWQLVLGLLRTMIGAGMDVNIIHFNAASNSHERDTGSNSSWA